ncbi:MAG: hypothetical protein JO313_03500 [Verrucomicrobia bacterium]|nr:hypothetical protein [Verrucomicrobiota bacterium]
MQRAQMIWYKRIIGSITHFGSSSSVPSSKSLEFRCVQNGPPARREEGAYLNGYATDERRSRRPVFNATLWAVSSWLFFRVARSLHIDLDMLVARALKNSQLAYGESPGI